MLEHVRPRGVERLLRQQAALAAFGSYAFRESVSLNILNEAARVCADGLGVPFCTICRYREAENDLLIEAGFGWNAGVVGLVVSKANESSPQGRAYVTGQPVILQDLEQADDIRLPAFYRDHHIISTIDVPIKRRDGEPYGVLEIDSPEQHIYDQNDVDFLTGFANVLAEAVATAARHDALRKTVEAMATQVIEKDRLLAERAMLAQELQHRVRNNLQLVHGMLHSDLQQRSLPQDRASMNAIIRRVSTLAEVYEQLLGSGMDRTIDLGQYLASLCDSLPAMQTAPTGHVALTCTVQRMLVDLDTVTALGMAVAELVSNSYEHAVPAGDAGVVIDVVLRHATASDEGILTVADNGRGFVEALGSKRHGVGLVRRLLQQVKGSADLLARQGTTWTLRFPVAPVGPAASVAALT